MLYCCCCCCCCCYYYYDYYYYYYYLIGANPRVRGWAKPYYDWDFTAAFADSLLFFSSSATSWLFDCL